MNIELIVIICILVFIVLQLHKSNVSQKENLSRKEDDRLDIDLRPKFPTLYLNYANEIRRYYRYIKKEREKEKRFPFANFLAGHIYTTRWYEIPEKLIQVFEDKKEYSQEIKLLLDKTFKFFKKAQNESYLNGEELEFLAYRLWENVSECDDSISYSKRFEQETEKIQMVVNEYKNHKVT